MARERIIAGNWKMYKTTADAVAFVSKFDALLSTVDCETDREIVICAPFTQLPALGKDLFLIGVGLGAQNMHFEEEGAFTGEVSAAMLKEAGVSYCIIGHSERRQYFAETDGTVNRKLHAAFGSGIIPIFCVGEALAQRDAGEEFSVVRSQVAAGLAGLPGQDAARLVIAYEPVWAIGTGRTATAAQAEEMCAFVRGEVERLYDAGVAQLVRIQYGGSVKPENAAEILDMPNIDGALVGGASLDPYAFFAVCEGKAR